MAKSTAATTIPIGKNTDGETVALDLEGVMSTRLLIQADSRGGKSWLFRLLAERCIEAGEQVIIIDPEGELATVRDAVKSDVLVLGGDLGDARLSPTMGTAVARFLAEQPVSAVIDLSLMELTPQRQFARDLFDAWHGIPRKLWGSRRIVLIDEAADFAPQSGDSCSLDAFARFLKRGGKRGFIPIPCTQRFSMLDKNIASLTRSAAIGPTAPGDKLRAADLMGVPKREAEKFVTLHVGHWLVRGAAFNTRAAVEFMSDKPKSRQPKPSDTRSKRTDTRTIRDTLKVFGELVDREDQEEAHNLQEAREQITALKKQVKKLEAAPTEYAIDQDTIDQAVTQAVINRDSEWKAAWDGLLDQINESARSLSTIAESTPDISPAKAAVLIPRETDTLPTRPKKVTKAKQTSSADADPALNNTQRKILTVLLHRKQMGQPTSPRKMIGTMVGIKSTGSTYSTYLSRLRKAGYIKGGGELSITAPGIAALGPVDPLPTGRELIQWYKANKLNSTQGVILDEIVKHHPNGVERPYLADAAEIDAGGSTFSTYLSRMRQLGIIQGKGLLTLTDAIAEGL